MSPNVLTERGYRFVIYFNDHAPAHIHVIKDGADARFTLEPIEMTHNRGFKKSDLKTIRSIIEDNKDFLLEMWDEIHADLDDSEE